MKKIIAGILSASLMMSTMTGIVHASGEHLDLFVQNGAVGGNGTIEAPFGTIEEARDHIRVLKKEGKYPLHGVTVNLREGEYRIREGLKFTEEDSGTKEGPVTYRPYVNEQVILNGGITIELYEFKNVTDEAILKRVPQNAKKGIKQYNLYENGVTREEFGEMYVSGTQTDTYTKIYDNINIEPCAPVFFGGARMNLARWPNDKYYLIDKVVQPGMRVEEFANWRDAVPIFREREPKGELNMVIGIPAEKAKLWKNVKDLWIMGYWKYTWDGSNVPIQSIDTDKNTLTTKYHGTYGATVGGMYYVNNCLEELDVPNEYYLDRDTGMLYFFPPESSGSMEIPLLKEDLITLDNVSNMRFKGFTVKNGCGGGFLGKNLNNFGIEHCSIFDFEKNAVDISRSTDSYVVSCHIYNVGRSGIQIEGGDKKTITPSGDYVENCWIHDFGQIVKTYQPGIYLKGVATRASFNRINDGPHSGMLTEGQAPLIEISNNEIYDVLKESSDSGAIYTGRTWTGRGQSVINNYIHDIGEGQEDVQGVYFDTFFAGGIVKSNIFENIDSNKSCGVAGGGRDTVITDNIFINCNGAYRAIAVPTNKEAMAKEYFFDVWAESDAYGLLANYYDEEIYSKHFPTITDYIDGDTLELSVEGAMYNMNYKYSVYDRNYGYKTPNDFLWVASGGHTTEEEKMASILWEDYTPLVQGSDPGFENMAKGDYSLKENAEIYKSIPDFVACDFENIGVYTQRLKDKLGNTISLKIGSPISYDGFKEKIIDDENFDVTPVIINGRTMLPVRYLAEILGGTAEWDGVTRIAVLNIGSDKIELDITNGAIKKNGELMETDTPPMIYENRTVAPLRVVAEILEKEVDWYDGGYDNQLIFINDTKVFDHEDKIDQMYIREMSGLLGVK